MARKNQTPQCSWGTLPLNFTVTSIRKKLNKALKNKINLQSQSLFFFSQTFFFTTEFIIIYDLPKQPAWKMYEAKRGKSKAPKRSPEKQDKLVKTQKKIQVQQFFICIYMDFMIRDNYTVNHNNIEEFIPVEYEREASNNALKNKKTELKIQLFHINHRFV